MSLLEWFGGDSKEVLKQMVKHNCAVLFYIGKGNDDFTEIFNDPNIIQLLNNELILCYKMDPNSTSFKNFKEIFNEVVVPCIYLLEKQNIHQYIIKTQNVMNPHNTQMDLKYRLVNAIHSIIKDISDTINVDDNKQKYLQYLTDITNKLQIIDNPTLNFDAQNVPIEVKKSNDTAKIKIKIPCKNVTVVKEFQTSSILNDVKMFVIKNYNLPKGSIKCIAHRQFTDEDFCQTLEALQLCPSSTIYIHVMPYTQWFHPIFNYQAWLGALHSTILKPYYFIQNYLMSLIRQPPPVEAPRTFNHQNTKQTNKKYTYKHDSNVHQLRNGNSDDDENNTYNGNSTQQL